MSWRNSLDRPIRKMNLWAWLAILPFLYSCASAEMQLGRQALFNNKPDEALARFQRVTESDPSYVNTYYQEGVWTYVGARSVSHRKAPRSPSVPRKSRFPA
jgi:hypothetical protein